MADDYSPIYQAAGNAFNVDPNLIQAVVQTESSGNPNAVSTDAQGNPIAHGLMQVTAPNLGAANVKNPYDPMQNVFAGTKVLSTALDQAKGNVPLALRIYQGGADTSGWGPQNAAYPGRVAAAYTRLKPAQSASAAQSKPSASATPDATDGFLAGKPAAGGAPDAADAFLTGQGAPPSGTAGAASAPDAPPDAADAFLTGANAPPAPPAQPHDGVVPFDRNNPSVIALSPTGAANLKAGFKQGLFEDVPNAIRQAGAWVDNRVPLLASLDRAVGIDPADAAKIPAQNAAYDAQYGNSPTAQLGRFGGQTMATAPILATGAGALGLVGDAAASTLGVTGRAIQAGTDLLTGSTAAAPGASLAPRVAARAVGLAGGGATAGATSAALTGQDPVAGAKAGALLGPVFGAATEAVPAIGDAAFSGAGKALSAGYNRLTGQAATRAIDAELAAADTRAGVPSALTGAAPPTNPLAVAPSANPLALMAPAKGPTLSDQIIAARQQAEAPIAATTPAAASTPGTAPVSANPLSQPAAPVAAVTPGAAPAPASAGAAATSPTDLTANAMTPAQAEASRLTGYNYRMTQQAPLAFDNAEYVPGSTPTRAEQLADPQLAAEQRVVAKGNNDFLEHDRANNEARVDYYDLLAGTPTTLETMEAARDAQASKDLNAAWGNKQDADAQPVQDLIDLRLSGPSGKLAPVRQALNEVSASLQKADGSGLETDPEMLYGARKQISYLLSKTGQRANPAYADNTVISNLQAVKSALDDAIEPAAPGYKQYLANYSAASRPIDMQGLLQDLRKTLVTQDGTMTLGGITRVMKTIQQKLATDGVNPAKSIDDDTLDGLFNIRADLLRENNRRLGMGIGSNTQQDQSTASRLGIGAAHLAAHGLATHVPGANVLVNPLFDKMAAASSGKTKDYLTRKLLGSYPMEANPLAAGVGPNPLQNSP